MGADQEDHASRPSQPRFHRAASSYILSNRFYIGERRRNGSVHAEGHVLKKSRGDRSSFEPGPALVERYAAAFLGPTPPYLVALERLARACA